MSLGLVLLTIVGLCAFEVISSIDNAVINADVLHTIKNKKARKFFITWGMFIAIFVVRGFLPFVIFYLANTKLGFIGSVVATWNSDPSVKTAIEHSAPILLIGGGMFLLLLFVHWLFLEDKEFGLPHEEFINNKIGSSLWFYVASAICLIIPALIMLVNNSVFHDKIFFLCISAFVGFLVFFATQWFKESAERAEEGLIKSGEGAKAGMSDWSKVLFLEVIDMTFSFDGVVGAFAFTMAVPLILLGNGLGAVVVRQLTLSNVERIKSYAYLKNGAMYSIGFLGCLMISESLGIHIPSWVSPIVTFGFIGFFLFKSIKKNKMAVGAAVVQ